MEKQGTKSGSGGFLHLFDWNRKLWKKLFSNKSDFPEGSNQGKRSSVNLQVTGFHQIKYKKEANDYSCSSSVTDDEGNGVKAPGVVARLMGLDSLLTATVGKAYSTPLSYERSTKLLIIVTFVTIQTAYSRKRPITDAMFDD
ncbi:hypothetical protein IFM89_035195 [Coptis chinensis]|uniref:DUF3741 domain-containing protein n=1 Tax=Coptis chinensis TaxID=261450 RepID=A0A835IG85_9MAGN|nr:hypothetical protein IFM89_035195 [Coptis chinensis]